MIWLLFSKEWISVSKSQFVTDFFVNLDTKRENILAIHGVSENKT